MSPKSVKNAYALKSRKALKLVPKMLADLDRELGQTVDAVKRGDIDLSLIHI